MEFHNKKIEPSGRSYTATDEPSSSNSTKKVKKTKNADSHATDHSAMGRAIQSGDFAGISSQEFSRFISQKINDATARGKAIGAGTAPYDVNYAKKGKGKGGKGGKGKGAKGPRDMSTVTCWDCQKTGHMRGSDECPKKGKATFHGGSTKSMKKAKKKNPAVDSAPYS